ncbi:hypothetical protein E5Q44_25450, partial [Escherichia coli]|nr:hypothetical protein [Escherichia coli]
MVQGNVIRNCRDN